MKSAGEASVKACRDLAAAFEKFGFKAEKNNIRIMKTIER